VGVGVDVELTDFMEVEGAQEVTGNPFRLWYELADSEIDFPDPSQDLTQKIGRGHGLRFEIKMQDVDLRADITVRTNSLKKRLGREAVD